VAALARSAGVTNARGTPSVAIGTYSATPIDMAGAYTVFANNGVHLTPWMLASVRNTNGDIVSDFSPEAKQILDPRVAYLTQSLMEGAMTYGTASSVRRHGFTGPGAGKTGTSHDAWFAGYTSNLICIVWVGNDDYTDIKLAGGTTAAPIWAEFMKRAQKIPRYSDMKGFSAPSGVVDVQIDKVTNRLSTPACPQYFSVAFIAGTEPKQTCEQAFADHRGIVSKILGLGTPEAAPPPNTNGPVQAPAAPGTKPGEPAPAADANAPADQQKKKPGFFHRVFGGKGSNQDQKPPAANTSPDKGNQPNPN